MQGLVTGLVKALAEGRAIRVQFDGDAQSAMGWRISDPSTGAFLGEGESTGDVVIALPEQDGPYRVQLAPVARENGRFFLIDAQVNGGAVEISPPRVATESTLRRERLRRAIPKAFSYPARSLWRNRKLIGSMVRRDILARYRGSFAGALWTIINPLLLMSTYAFVFGFVLKTRFGNDTSGIAYVLYFLAGMLPWLAVSEAVGRAPYVILEYRNFVKKLVFPLETLPVNLVISGAVTEGFALAIFVVGVLLARHTIPVSVVWLPALIVPQLLFTVGLCWLLAALGVFMRDLGTIMGFLLTLWFFMTPICYPETSLPAASLKILALNPVFVLVRGYRAIFLENHAPDLMALAILSIVSAALAVFGHAWFHRLRKNFADII